MLTEEPCSATAVLLILTTVFFLHKGVVLQAFPSHLSPTACLGGAELLGAHDVAS